MDRKHVMPILLGINLLITLVMGFYLFQSRTLEIDLSEEILRVRGLVVTDSSGRERIIIGAPLPPAQSIGYRFYRGKNSNVSGIMLYDHEGQERSGYVTDDSYGNVFFTLDSKISQRALFVAEPQGAVTLRLWGKNGHQIDIGTSDDDTWMNVGSEGQIKDLIDED
ncbi:hypothetical protein [Algoriphagus sp.]|uniref:hypothetical protein n=1 Tax=Algoriphagus sp. TaxID=1872435 RepID=UPI003F6FB42A